MSRRLRNSVWLRHFGNALTAFCHWCRTPLTHDEATVDHEPPRCSGGTDQTAVIACWACNQQRNKNIAY